MAEETTPNIIKTIGYHGTYERHVSSILENNFFESKDHNKWFGDGVYFFVDGLSEPMDTAYNFKTDEKARDRDTDNVVVLEVIIKVNNDTFLDLTKNDGLQLFNSYRKEVLDRIKLSGQTPLEKIEDHDLLGNMRENLGIEFVKGNLYIKFGIQRKRKFFPSMIPNVTIFVVNNAPKNIEKDSIKQIV